MASNIVRFERDRGGLVVNFWIKSPDGSWAKLVFRNDKASASLDLGQNYVLFWDALGTPGSKISVKRKVEGVDDAFKELLTDWELPDNPNTPPGVPDRYRDTISFIL